MEQITFTDFETFRNGIATATAKRLEQVEAEAELLRSYISRKSDSAPADIFETDIKRIKEYESYFANYDLKIIKIPINVVTTLRKPYTEIDDRFIELYTKVASGVKITPPILADNTCTIDGGHRITLAYLLGYKEIPILIANYLGV